MGLKTRAARRKQSSDAFFPRRDVAARCLDFLEARDSFGRASLVSHALFDAASTLKGRLPLETFSKISTCLNDEWDCKEVENSDYESDSDASGEDYFDRSNRYGEYRYREEYTVVKCEIKRFSLYTDLCYGWPEGSSLETDDLKDLIVIEKPEITFIGGCDTYSAPNGRWFTVGDLFDCIADFEASYREGPDNHVYFEGFGRNRRGHYGVIFWGS